MGDIQKEQLSFLSGGQHSCSVHLNSVNIMNTYPPPRQKIHKAYKSLLENSIWSDLAYPKDNHLSSPNDQNDKNFHRRGKMGWKN